MLYCHKHEWCSNENETFCPGCFDDDAHKIYANMEKNFASKSSSESQEIHPLSQIPQSVCAALNTIIKSF